MDTKQKYIKTELGEVVIFPATISHDEFKNWKPVSAGFCYVKKNSVACFGESYSMKLKADDSDSEQATRQVFGIDAMLALQQKK
jgi:hypothetical protein